VTFKVPPCHGVQGCGTVQQLTLGCDLFLAISLREVTEIDEIADLVIRQDIGTVLSPFIVH
jgi:hypothetical protein